MAIVRFQGRFAQGTGTPTVRDIREAGVKKLRLTVIVSSKTYTMQIGASTRTADNRKAWEVTLHEPNRSPQQGLLVFDSNKSEPWEFRPTTQQ